MKMETTNYVLWMYGVKKRTNSICQFEMQNVFKISLLLNFFILTHSLRKKDFVFGVILVRIFPAFSRIRSEYGEILRISRYSIRMLENAGKMRTRITPSTDTFYAVICSQFTLSLTPENIRKPYGLMIFHGVEIG